MDRFLIIRQRSAEYLAPSLVDFPDSGTATPDTLESIDFYLLVLRVPWIFVPLDRLYISTVVGVEKVDRPNTRSVQRQPCVLPVIGSDENDCAAPQTAPNHSVTVDLGDL